MTMELRNNNREVIRELARANYRKNRGRNRVLTLAVALAVFMVFGAFSIARGKMEADYLLYARNDGSVASLSLEDGSEKQYEKIKTLDYVKNTGLEKDFAVWYKGGAPVLGCTVLDNTAFEKLIRPAYTDVTGHYPEEANEVMLPLRGLEQLGIENPHIGMTLDAELRFQENRDAIESSFVLSGYYKDYVNPILNAPVAYFSEKYLESLGIPLFPASYILMEQNGFFADGELMEAKLYEDVSTESVAQQFIGMNSLAFTVVEDFIGSYMVAFLCSVMILGGAFLLIYNVMSITLGNDIRQYGLLKTIGTTGGQIKKIVFCQTGRMILAGCLLGAAAGSFVVKFLLPGTLGELYLHGMGSAGGMAVFYPAFLAASVMFVGLTTLLAAGIAVRKVVKFSPIESVRYEETASAAASHTYRRQRRTRQPRSSILQRCGSRKHCSDGASIAGMAWRNITRSGRRFAVTLLSLSMGGICALGAVVISRGTDITNSIEERHDFEISTFTNIDRDAGYASYDWDDNTPVITEELRDRILAVDGVSEDKMGYTKGCFAMINMPSETNGTEEGGDEALLPRLKSVYGTTAVSFFATLQIVDDAFVEELRKYVEEYGINADVDSLENGTGTMLLHTHELSKELQEDGDETIGMPLHFYSLSLFENKVDDKYLKGELSCAGYLDISKKHFPKLNMTTHGSGINYFIMTEKAFRSLNFKEKIFGIQIDVDRQKEPLIKQEITGIIQQDNRTRDEKHYIYMNSKSDALNDASSYIRASRIVMGVLSVLLMVMGIANYFNTLYTSLSSRQKELAVMESVGMTRKQLGRLVVLEGAFYGLSVIGILLTLGSAVLWFLGKAIKQDLLYFKFYYPWAWTAVIAASLPAICILTAVFMYRRMTGKSITERLRRYAD